MISVFIQWFFKKSSVPNRVARIMFLAITMSIIFGVAFYFVEKPINPSLSIGDSIWWAMVTMTTVGYGDYFPQSLVGRYFVAYPCFLLGIGIFGYLLGMLADTLIEHTSLKRKGRLLSMKKNHILICNCPSPGKVLQIIRELRFIPEHKERCITLIADELNEITEELREAGIDFVQGDPASEEVLIRAGVKSCYGALVLADVLSKPADSDARTFAISAVIAGMEQEIGRELRIVSELLNKQNRQMILRTGTDGVIAHEGLTDSLIVQEFLYPGVYEIFGQIITNAIGSQFFILDTQLSGYKVYDIQIAALKHTNNLQVIGIIEEGRYCLNPPKTLTIKKGSKLIVLAEMKTLFFEMEEALLAEK